MKPRHVAALVIGCLLLLPGLALLFGGGAVGVIELAARDDGGWHSVQINPLESSGVAVTTEDTMARIEGPAPALSWLDLQMRVRVTPTDPAKAVFVGVGPSDAVTAYLGGAARDEVTRVGVTGTPTYRFVPGSGTVAAPAEQTFWDESASGTGVRELTWTLASGKWTVAVLNADGSEGVRVAADVAVRSGALLPMAVGMLIGGLVLAAIGGVLIVSAVRGRGAGQPTEPSGIRPLADAATAPWASVATDTTHPLVLEARLAPDLSRWLWLVKWFLAIPHFIVLTFLWVAFGVTTFLAWWAILFTGQYPRALFDFNVGVLRWTWRVSYYAGTGGLGTDRYPPFALEALPDDDVRLDVAYPERLSRGLIFVKWLLLLPHWIIVALLAGTQSRRDEHGLEVGGWPGVIALLVIVAGLVLLFTESYPRGLFDVIVGLNRWVFRVGVYAALMTDVYPPFRYDGGGTEPGRPPVGAPPTAGPGLPVPDDAPRPPDREEARS